MQELEKILEELGAYICDDLCYYRETSVDKDSEELCDGCKVGEYLKAIRKHMSDKDKDVPDTFEFDFVNVKSFDCKCGRHYVNTADYGWIPVEVRLPEEKANPVSQDFYEYQVTAKFGNVKDVRHYKYGNGHWWHGPGIVDKYVIAWRPLPEPYRPERSEGE